MKIRAIQFSPKLGNLEANLDFHVSKITQAINDKIDLIIFPELSISGYQLKDIVYDIALGSNDPILRRLKELSKNIDIVFGLPYEEYPGIIFNSALYLKNGQVHHNHRKVNLPNFGMFEEAMIFKAGSRFESFKIGEFTAGIIICREILFPINAYLYYMQNVDFLIAISNSPYRGISQSGFTSLKLWERLGEVYAINFHLNYVFVNRSGFEDGMGFGGGSFYAAPGAGIIKKAPYMEESCLDFSINLESVRRSRIGGNYLRDERPELIFQELKRILNA